MSTPDDELLNRFNYHKPPNDKVVKLHEDTRNALLEAAAYIVDNLPDCRDRSIAIMKLEEAMFWANAAIARNHEFFFPDD